jgi:hypothetical protein
VTSVKELYWTNRRAANGGDPRWGYMRFDFDFDAVSPEVWHFGLGSQI